MIIRLDVRDFKKVEQATEFVPSNPQPTQPPVTQGVQVVQPEVDEIPF